MDAFFVNRTLRRKQRMEMGRIRRNLRDESDPFNILTDAQFVRVFRLQKSMLRIVVSKLVPYMHDGYTYHALSPMIRIFTTLNFYANGSYQRPVGQDFIIAMSQTSVSRCILEVTSIINEKLTIQLIKFPTTDEERNQTKQKFFMKYGFPGIIGAVDGTHILIRKPHNDVEHAYYAVRKSSHSKNVQLVFDFDYKILGINARYGGSAHDSYIWNNSLIKQQLTGEFINGRRGEWLLGDSGYGLQPWLMTPIAQPENEGQELFNKAHKKARSSVERGIGVFKSRFRCLSKQRILMYSPSKSGAIINACAALHNFLILHGFPLPSEENILRHMENEIQVEVQPADIDGIRVLNEGKVTRSQIIRDYFKKKILFNIKINFL